MRISLIVALDRHGLIGIGNALPWRLPADLRRFRHLTIGKPIIMGRKTFEHLGRPLPERTNIVLTRQTDVNFPGCLIAPTVAEAIERAGPVEEIMIIGGAEIYRLALPMVERMYVTVVSGQFEGDCYFPLGEIDDFPVTVIEDEPMPADEKNRHPHRFLVLDRVTTGTTLRELVQSPTKSRE